MANARKAAKRARKAIRNLTDNTADRADDVIKKGLALTPQELRTHFINQVNDGIDAWLTLVTAFAEQPPTVVIEANLNGVAAGTTINPNATVDLDASVSNINNLTVTPLTCPGQAVSLAMNYPLTPIPPGPPPEIDTVQITVPVTAPPVAGSTNGLYSGFVLLGQAIQVRVNVWVHT